MPSNGSVKYEMRLGFSQCQGAAPCGAADAGEADEFDEEEVFIGFAGGLISAAGAPSAAVSLLAGNSSLGAKTIAGAGGSGLGGGQASPCPAFELGPAVFAGRGGWCAATMPADDGDGFGSEEHLAARLVAAVGTKALPASLLIGKICRGVP